MCLISILFLFASSSALASFMAQHGGSTVTAGTAYGVDGTSCSADTARAIAFASYRSSCALLLEQNKHNIAAVAAREVCIFMCVYVFTPLSLLCV
jgi:hypothetical protein